MASAWIEGSVVHLVSFRDDLVLNLDHQSELVISGAMQLTLPAAGGYSVEAVTVDPTSVPPHLRPLLNFSGSTCTHASWNGAGNLHLEFSCDRQVDVPSSAHTTAWELYGKHHGYIACLPHGEMHIVRHDLLRDADNAKRAGART